MATKRVEGYHHSKKQYRAPFRPLQAPMPTEVIDDPVAANLMDHWRRVVGNADARRLRATSGRSVIAFSAPRLISPMKYTTMSLLNIVARENPAQIPNLYFYKIGFPEPGVCYTRAAVDLAQTPTPHAASGGCLSLAKDPLWAEFGMRMMDEAMSKAMREDSMFPSTPQFPEIWAGSKEPLDCPEGVDSQLWADKMLGPSHLTDYNYLVPLKYLPDTSAFSVDDLYFDMRPLTKEYGTARLRFSDVGMGFSKEDYDVLKACRANPDALSPEQTETIMRMVASTKSFLAKLGFSLTDDDTFGFLILQHTDIPVERISCPEFLAERAADKIWHLNYHQLKNAELAPRPVLQVFRTPVIEDDVMTLVDGEIDVHPPIRYRAGSANEARSKSDGGT